MNDPFLNCMQYAFRVEGLPSYDVPGTDEKLEMYRDTGKVDPAMNAEWAETVANCIARGCVVRRLRLVSDPLSFYEQFELNAGYRPGINAGEEIRIVVRSTVPSVADFWAFDDTWIRRMNYDANGKFLGSEVAEMDPRELEMTRYWLGVFENAQPVT